MDSISRSYFFHFKLFLSLSVLTGTVKVAFAEVSACRQSLDPHSYFASIAPESNLKGQNLTKPIATFLNLIDVLLEEIGKSQADALESQVRLLKFIIQSESPTQILEDYPGEKTHFLILLRNSYALKTLTSAITHENWRQIQQFANDKISELRRLTGQHQVRADEGQQDFIDTPDINGRVRLHHLLESRQYDEAIALLENPKTTTRYINTRDKSGKTPRDLFEDTIFESTVGRNESAPGSLTANLSIIGQGSPAKIAAVLIEKSAMTGNELEILDQDFIAYGLFSLPKDLRAENLYEGLTGFYEKGGNLFAELEYGTSIASVFATTGHLEGLKKLKSFGDNFAYRNSLGETLLHLAAHHEYWEVFPFLVESGLDINAPDKDGRTPIFYLSHFNPRATVEMFVKLGANLNHRNEQGETPAHLCTSPGHADRLRALAENGANLELQDKLGLAPLSYSIENDQRTLAVFADYFLSKGINPESRGLYKTDSNPPTYFKKENSSQ